MMERRMNKEMLEKVADFYIVKKDYDYFNTKLASIIISPLCENKNVLEIGCADGVMTEDLVKVSRTLTVVEPSTGYCDIIRKNHTDVRVNNCFLEEVKDTAKFDVVVMASLLHHIKDPVSYLDIVKKFLGDNGVVLATVPSMTSLHRQIGVKAGALQDIYDTTERNAQFNQFGRYDKPSFEALFRRCGYDVLESYGYMLKPFSSEQMMSLRLDWKVIMALFEIGKENEHLASQLFLRARLGSL